MPVSEIPEYERLSERMLNERSLWARDFAEQIRITIAPFIKKPLIESRVLDLGCGYGFTANELSSLCESIVGVEPSTPLYDYAQERFGYVDNITFINGAIESIGEGENFDLIILDNVFEHIPNQMEVLAQIEGKLDEHGVVFMLMPNKLWPIEVHYRLPFLSYLPLSLANMYLRVAGKGKDYTDASYAPSYWGLKRMVKQTPGLAGQFVLPGDINLAKGVGLVYRIGVHLISKFPLLWAISKSFLMIVKKTEKNS